MIARFARELEAGDLIRWRGRLLTVMAVDIEHQVVRLTFAGAHMRLPTWTPVLCRF